jgi:hypothetical protein
MRLAFAFALLVAAAPAFADHHFDGLWKPLGDAYTCDPQEVDGATPVRGNWYGETEGECTLANPTAVRGLNATLFDVTCSGDWGSLDRRELFMLYRDQDGNERLLIVGPDGATTFVRCQLR